MPQDVQFPIHFGGARSPYTPQKPGGNLPGGLVNNSTTKARPGNKSRQKQGSASPGPIKPGRTTPPQSAASKTMGAAFAGATFHASPAPSSLPIPSFLAKALDSPGLKENGPVSNEPSPPATDSEAPTPKHRPLVADIAREESPLDFFFRADRAEKERARRASSANVLATNPGPFSPPVLPTSPQEPRTLPKGRRPTSQRNSSFGISANELDGTPGRPMGPAFSTPYQDRIRAARSNEKSPTSQTNDVLSERLKRFLAVSTNLDPAQKPEPQGQGDISRALSNTQPTIAPPNTATDEYKPPDLSYMEDSLRRMLKISPGTTSGAAPPTSYR